MTRTTLAGLGLSAAGDVALLGDDDRSFLAGLGSFLGAHLAYLAAFHPRRRPWLEPGNAYRLAPVALAWAAVLPVLARRAGSMQLPVAVYGSALAAVQASALLLADDVPPASRTRIVAGAACFLVSDMLLGARRFLLGGGHERLDRAVDGAVMATYTSAQWLIADGVSRCPAVTPQRS